MDLNAIIQVYVLVIGIQVCIFWVKQEEKKIWKHLSEKTLWYLQLVLKICLAKEKKFT